MENNSQLSESLDAYDEMPYENQSYPQSNPYHLMTLGVLFGMHPTIPTKARILELGCASGWNILPHAVNYPEAEFIGVDLSTVQINEANKHARGLGLKNIKFQHCSVTDIDESWGKFDYIIVHGLLSWVPDFVRNKIFEICNKSLSPNGIAYLSYNTLPGWNMVYSIRDMMLYYTKSAKNSYEKCAQAREVLSLVSNSLDSKTLSHRMLKFEINLLDNLPDNYLRHDHLGSDSKPFYFYEIMDQAHENKLQYLSDCSLFSTFINTPNAVAELLQDEDDIVKEEQYMDFIKNRRYRATLLCHNDLPLDRVINNEKLMQFNISCVLLPTVDIKEININNETEILEFIASDDSDARLSTSSPYLKAILYSFAKYYNYPLSFNELIAHANHQLGNNQLEELQNTLLNNLVSLVSQGYINITLQHFSNGKINLKKPCLAPVSLYQVNNTQNEWVTNLKHEIVGVNDLEKIAMQQMNGQKSKEQILKHILLYINEKGLALTDSEGKPLEDQQEIKQQLSFFLDEVLAKMENNCLLV